MWQSRTCQLAFASFSWGGGRRRSRGAISPYIPSSLPLALSTSHKSGGKRKLPPSFAASPPPRLSLSAHSFLQSVLSIPVFPLQRRKERLSSPAEQESFSPFAAASLHGKGATAKRGENRGRERPANFLFLLPAPLSPLRFPVSLRTWAGKADKAEAGQTTTTPQKGRGKSGGGGGGGGRGRAHRPRAPRLSKMSGRWPRSRRGTTGQMIKSKGRGAGVRKTRMTYKPPVRPGPRVSPGR